MSRILHRITSAVLAAAVVCGGSTLYARDELGARASWQQPSAKEIRQQVFKWLETTGEVDELTKVKVEALWPEEGGPQSGSHLLDQAAATFALLNPQAMEVVTFCREQRKRFALRQFDILHDEEAHPLLRHNLQLLYGRWLAQQQLYDEAAEMLKDLKPEDVIDPASLLFYQSVAYHRTLKKDECLPKIAKLLENEDALPRRYQTVAKLMEADLKPLKEDSLDEIARLMDAIRLEMEHARAGKRVRTRQEEVIAKLDKLIDELEKQRQQQQSSSSSPQNQPSSPMDDSNPGGGKGPGNVEQKPIGNRSGWGNLPPKEREEALQQISKEFPSHFREVIEAYFRKLARDNEE